VTTDDALDVRWKQDLLIDDPVAETGRELVDRANGRREELNRPGKQIPGV